VLLPMRAHARCPQGHERESDELLTSLGLGEQTGKRPNQLSGGQRQRVALARRSPTVPKSSSPTSRREISTPLRPAGIGILRDIATTAQTVVVVTHDAALAARADRRIHIVDGKIHETTFGGHRKPEIAVATPAWNARRDGLRDVTVENVATPPSLLWRHSRRFAFNRRLKAASLSR